MAAANYLEKDTADGINEVSDVPWVSAINTGTRSAVMSAVSIGTCVYPATRLERADGSAGPPPSSRL